MFGLVYFFLAYIGEEEDFPFQKFTNAGYSTLILLVFCYATNKVFAPYLSMVLKSQTDAFLHLLLFFL